MHELATANVDLALAGGTIDDHDPVEECRAVLNVKEGKKRRMLAGRMRHHQPDNRRGYFVARSNEQIIGVGERVTRKEDPHGCGHRRHLSCFILQLIVGNYGKQLTHLLREILTIALTILDLPKGVRGYEVAAVVLPLDWNRKVPLTLECIEFPASNCLASSCVVPAHTLTGTGR